MYAYAISQLRVSLDTVESNAPIWAAEGNVKQAEHSRRCIRSYKSAIELLEAAEKQNYEQTRAIVGDMRPFPEGG